MHEKSNTCIHRNDTARSWVDSRKYCQSVAGDLVKVEDGEMDRFLADLGPGGWIGLARTNCTEFKWVVDNSQVT